MKLLHAVLLLRKFLANATDVSSFYLIGFKAGNPGTQGTYRSLLVYVIEAWQAGGLSNDMTGRVKNIINRSAQLTEQAFIKNKAVFHKKCLFKYDGAQLKRLQMDLTEEVGLVSIQI